MAALSPCPACEERGAGRGGVCSACATALRAAVASLPAPTGDALWLGPHAGVWRRLVHALKYRSALQLSPTLARLLAVRAARWDWQPQLVVPLPTAASRRAKRGYDQAELLARDLAGALSVPCSLALQRVHDTPKLAGQGRAARGASLEGAFRSRRVRGLRVLLVDDVLTTGATLRSARAALLAGGAAEVRTAVVARTALPHEEEAQEPSGGFRA